MSFRALFVSVWEGSTMKRTLTWSPLVLAAGILACGALMSAVERTREAADRLE
jgi:hypothetical protein